MNFVNEIIDAIESEIETLLPVYKKLDYIYDLTRNSFTGQDTAYGVLPDQSSFSDGNTTCSYMLDHTFRVMLTRNFFNSGDDISQREAIEQLYIDMDSIAHSLIWQKLGKSYIIKLSFAGTEPPEELNESDVAVLIGTFIIKYRRQK